MREVVGSGRERLSSVLPRSLEPQDLQGQLAHSSHTRVRKRAFIAID
ncbi:hypothetical protein [Methanoculleus sp.]